MKEIELTQGKMTLVDDEDFEELNRFKWHAHKEGTSFYALRFSYSPGGKRICIRMHREILKPPREMQCDHIDHNGLNNYRENLRICTSLQNHMNRQLNKNSTSGLKGVHWNKRCKKWQVRMQINNKRKSVGYFLNKEEAGKAYDGMAKKYFGEFAHLNGDNS